jgi:hypothetical protein
MCNKRFVKGRSTPHQLHVEHWEQVSEIHRLKLHVHQLEQQHVRHQDQVVLGHQHRSLAPKDFTTLSGSILNGSCLSATLSLAHSGYDQLRARAVYCTSISVVALSPFIATGSCCGRKPCTRTRCYSQEPHGRVDRCRSLQRRFIQGLQCQK